jgi:hypothetical protein
MDDNASELNVSQLFMQKHLLGFPFRPLRPAIEARLAFRAEHPGFALPLSLPIPN